MVKKHCTTATTATRTFQGKSVLNAQNVLILIFVLSASLLERRSRFTRATTHTESWYMHIFIYLCKLFFISCSNAQSNVVSVVTKLWFFQNRAVSSHRCYEICCSQLFLLYGYGVLESTTGGG
jgi:hypothetical protein